jgi:hypothetical protein
LRRLNTISGNADQLDHKNLRFSLITPLRLMQVVAMLCTWMMYFPSWYYYTLLHLL